MNRHLKALTVMALLAFVSTLCGDDNKPRSKLSELMQSKLQNAQKVLEGIALNDFDKIIKHGDELIFISKQAEWQVVKTPDYEVRSNEFRRAVQSMIDKAKEKNLDGAALGYVDTTLSCVKCHKYVRAVRMTRLDKDPWDGREAALPLSP